MPIGSSNLTGETQAQTLTFPGQAHFAIPGAKKRCHQCGFWEPKRARDNMAICGKAVQLLCTDSPRRIPGSAIICRYFEEKIKAAAHRR
jgi:hypothetical protein